MGVYQFPAIFGIFVHNFGIFVSLLRFQDFSNLCHLVIVEWLQCPKDITRLNQLDGILGGSKKTWIRDGGDFGRETCMEDAKPVTTPMTEEREEEDDDAH